MGLFDDTAASIGALFDCAEHVVFPADVVAGAMTPLREAVQELFEDWLSRTLDRGAFGTSAFAVLAKAEERATALGLEWRHAEELAELEREILSFNDYD